MSGAPTNPEKARSVQSVNWIGGVNVDRLTALLLEILQRIDRLEERMKIR